MNTTRLLRNTICVVMLAGALFTAASAAQAQVYVSIGIAPPAIPIYTQPLCPGDGYIWAPGYWAYGDDGYYWVDGVWVLAPYVGALWIPGYWAYGPSGYFWNPGFWGRNVGPGEANRIANATSGRPNYGDITINSTGVHNNVINAPPSPTNYSNITINSTGVHNNYQRPSVPPNYSNITINSTGVHNNMGPGNIGGGERANMGGGGGNMGAGGGFHGGGLHVGGHDRR